MKFNSENSNAIYLTTEQVAKRFKLKRNDDISQLIRKNSFPNAFKNGKYWHIPMEDIRTYELSLNKTKNCLNISQTSKRLGYEKHMFYNLIKKSVFPNAFFLSGKWWIPVTDIELFEKERSNTLNAYQVRDKLKLNSVNQARHLINNKTFPNAYKDFSNNWRVSIEDIKNYEETINNQQKKFLIKINKEKEFLSNNLDIKQTMKRLGYSHPFSVIQLINKSLLPNAFKVNKKWWVPLNDIENIENKKAGTFDTTQTATKLNLKSIKSVTDLIYKNIFPNAFKDDFSRWRIPLNDIDKYIEKNDNKDFVNLIEAASILGYKSTSSVRIALLNHQFKRTFKYKGRWQIHKDDLEIMHSKLYKSKNKSTKNQTKKIALKNDLKVKDYLSVEDLQKKLNTSRYKILKLIHNEALLSSMKYRNRWWVTKHSFNNYLKEVSGKQKQTKVKNILISSTANIENTLSTKDAAKRLNYKDSASLSLLIKKQKLPNAFKVNGSWRIPVSDIEHLENINKKIEYTPKLAFSELKNYIEKIVIRKELSETKTIFIQYCLLRINSMSGSNSYRRSRILLYKRFYKLLMDTISNEIFLISNKEITKNLQANSSFRKDQKKLLISFLNYTYNQKNIKPDFQFSLLTTNKQTSEKDIYSPKTFHNIYQYVKSTYTHIPNAIADQSYANMWVYTILLLTDFIRGQDLIMNTPNIDLKMIDILSFNQLNQNELSDYQIQTIIKQLYMHFRHKRTSKTDELLTFIVAPDLERPLAYALAISELHRSHENNEILLDTFLVGKFNTVKTSGKISHKYFFDNMKNSLDFQFSSLKMNRTVATYLFYSVAEEDGQDSDLALYLTQVSRSHKSTDSTSIYVQATNKDGSINRVSYNLFKRGHFGWLYNYLILYVSQFENIHENLEERTKVIEGIREEVSPINLENTAKFAYNSLIPIPLKDNSKNMETFLQNIYMKRQTVISKLKDYSKEEIRKIITKLANGDLPSKSQHAQCLVYPDCKRPKLSNCFSCEYVIPGNLMLIQLNEELNRLIKDLDNTTNEILLKRDSMFLKHALLIWKEARIAFGNEKVNAYIPSKIKWKEIEKVAHKLSLE